jgi:hypothetical protein
MYGLPEASYHQNTARVIKCEQRVKCDIQSVQFQKCNKSATVHMCHVHQASHTEVTTNGVKYLRTLAL